MARIRTFIAVALEKAVCKRLAVLRNKLAQTHPELKWVVDDNYHITLLFLGEVAELDVVPICRIVAEQAKQIPPFNLEIGGLGAFPNPRRAKILWAGIREGADSLKAIHSAIESPLLELGCYRREERAYSPHLTLGRVNRDDAEFDWGPTLSRYADWKGGETRIEEILIMSSELGRAGPVYSLMGRGRLKGVPVLMEDENDD